MKDVRLYWIWAAIIQRCTNPMAKQYADYGGRGITICEAWRKFSRFAADVGARPNGLSLDRIDSERGYEPGNVRWADRTTQNSNRRCCTMVSDAGESVTLKEYCRRHDLKYRAVVKRIKDRGWPLDVALSIPVGSAAWGSNRQFSKKRVSNMRYETAFGRTQSVIDWSREYNINRSALMRRLHLGWPIEKALTIPLYYRIST